MDATIKRFVDALEAIEKQLAEASIDVQGPREFEEDHTGSIEVQYTYRLKLKDDSDLARSQMQGYLDEVTRLHTDAMTKAPIVAVGPLREILTVLERIQTFMARGEHCTTSSLFGFDDDGYPEFRSHSSWTSEELRKLDVGFAHKHDQMPDESATAIRQVVDMLKHEPSPNVDRDAAEDQVTGFQGSLARLLATVQSVPLVNMNDEWKRQEIRKDAELTIREIETCIRERCYIAAIALSGRLLEMGLKLLLVAAEKDVLEKEGINGLHKQLLGLAEHGRVPEIVLRTLTAPQMGQFLNAVQVYRNACAHSREDPLFPTPEHVNIVVSSLILFWQQAKRALEMLDAARKSRQ